jgi:GT2 family glycosyltransferase
MVNLVIIILHYKGEQETRECLLSLTRTNGWDPKKVIVVTNASPREFAVSLRNKFSIEVIENHENLGFAAGNNVAMVRAIEELGATHLVLLNNDTIVPETFLQDLKKSIHAHPTAIFSNKIYFAPGFEYHQTRYANNERGNVIWYAGGLIDWDNVYASHRGVDEVDKGQYDEAIETDFATGCCLVVQKEAIDQIGYLDDKYFVYYEDVEYSQRAKQEGLRIMYCPESYVWHKNAASSGPGSDIHVYYQTRNRLLFGMTYASFRTRRALFVESVRMLLHGGVQATAVKDYYLKRFGRKSI